MATAQPAVSSGKVMRMTGRRSHPRFIVGNPWEGAIRVLRDVVIDRTSPNEFLAVSQAPGVLGENMRLDLMGGGLTMALQVTVLESRPIIVAGAVRHRIRLGLVPQMTSSIGRPTGAGAELTAEAM